MPAADDGFVSLAERLAQPASVVPAPVAPSVEPAALPAPIALPALEELLRDVRLFRARLADALDTSLDVVVRELAVAIVGRELLLAPADVAAIATRIIATHPAVSPVVLRVAPEDAARVAGIVPARSDPALAPGDLVLEFAGAAHDARLGVRLAHALAAWS